MDSVYDFISEDNMKGLFPLNSIIEYARVGESELREYIYKDIFSTEKHSFLQSPVVYALKDKSHLRKTHLLDPVASFYIYDFTLRNCNYFQKDSNSDRLNYGYAFVGNDRLNSFKEYHEFRKKKYELKRKFRYFAKVDISDCFNSFYHHDISSYISDAISQLEGNQFGKFLRESNGGRSVNCFPQGIFPAKTIGNFFLGFIESSRELESKSIIRFLDDIYLFSNSMRVLEEDVIRLQTIIGDRALTLNAQKTKFGSRQSDFDERNLDTIKKSLLIKREVIRDYDDENHEEIELSAHEVEYLTSIIQKKDVAEEDVELALSLLKEDQYEALQLVKLVFEKYPSLIKHLYRFIRDINDDGDIWSLLEKKVRSKFLQEFELFWIARYVIDHYEFNEYCAEILLKIFRHSSATTVVKAAILEFQENGFGLYELKESYLRNESNGILAASAIVGLAKSEKSKRNHLFSYVKKTSPFLNVLCKIGSKM